MTTAKFIGGPYSGKTLELPMPENAAYLEIDGTGTYDRTGTDNTGAALFTWVATPDPEAVDA